MGRIVLTGSSGLVGSAVISYTLSNTDHSLLLIDSKPPKEKIENPRLQYLSLNLLDSEAWAEHLKGADALIHLAAIPQPWFGTAQFTHNTNVQLSYNALCAAADAGLKRVVIASSINAIGGAWNKELPRYDYFPVDEKHPAYPIEQYSVSKLIGEIQADQIALANPEMSIASLRFHYVLPAHRRPVLSIENKGKAKDLWGWTQNVAAARACLLALEMGDERVGYGQDAEVIASVKGHEIFFIVGETHCGEGKTASELAEAWFPHVPFRRQLEPNEGFYDCTKAKRMFGWEHTGGLEALPDW